MHLYIMRHGEAGPSQPWASDDARTLTDEGREELRRIGRFLAGVGLHPDAIISSPLPRALETARIIADALGTPGAVVEDPALAPGCRPAGFQAAFHRNRGERTMFVGHEPDLSTLIGWLTGGWVEMPKAGFARVNGLFDANQAGLEWLLTPRLMALASTREDTDS